MARLNVNITANSAGFTAAIGQMVASARTGSASIKSALDSSFVGPGAARTGVTQSIEKLTKARTAEAAAAGKVAVAEAHLSEVRKGSARSIAAQTSARNALTTATVNHGKILRDTANEITKAAGVEESAFRRVQLADLDRADVARKLANQEEVSARRRMRVDKEVFDSERLYNQAARANTLVQTEQNLKRQKAVRDLAAAEQHYNEVSSVRQAKASQILSAENSLVNAQTNHAKASRVVASASEEMAAANLTATRASGRLNAALEQVTERRAKIDGIANTMLKVGAVGAVGLGLATKAAIDWQKQWTEVTKTVDFSNSKWGSSTEAMAANEDALRGLTKQLPATHSEIAQTAALLGTLGVGANDLADMTKVATQLSTTTNLTAEQAATGLKQIMTVMGDAPKTVGNLGSALVALGLDGASTEKQILQTGLRIASAGKSVGFASQDVLALGSSLASVGIQAEAGGNNMATTLTKIDGAVRKGGDGLAQYAKLTGLTSDQFKESWGKDAPQALALVLDGLGKFQAQGGDVTAMLRSMGINNIREIRNLRDLANATKAAGGQVDLYRDQLQLSREEQQKGTKLGETASKTYQTDAAKIQLALNSISDAAITVGGSLLPVVAQISDGIANLANSFGDLDPHMQSFIVKGAAFASVALLLGGGLLRLGTSVVGLIVNLKALGVAGNAAATGLGKFSIALAGIVIGGAAVAALGNYIDKLNTLPNAAEKAQVALDDLVTTGSDVNLNKMFDFSGAKTGDLAIVQKDVTGFGEAMARVDTGGMLDTGDKINDFFTGVLESFGGAKGIHTLIEERTAGIDDALGAMVKSGNVKSAGKAFKEMSADALKHGITLDKLLPKFDTYADALANLAKDTYGVTLSQKEVVEWMGGKVPKAIAVSTRATEDQSTAQQKLTSDIIAAQSALAELMAGNKRSAQQSQTLASELFIQGNLAQNAAAGHLAFAEAVDQASAVMDKNGKYLTKNGKALSDNTAKGRENETALLNLATSGKAWVQSLVAQGAGSEKASKATDKVRKAFIKTAEDAGLGSKAAEHLADSYGLIPGEVSTHIDLFMEALNQTRIEDWHKSLDALPKEEKAKILAIYERKGAAAAKKELDDFEKKHHPKPKITPKYEPKDTNRAKGDLKTTGQLHPKPKIEPVYDPSGVYAAEQGLNGLPTTKTITITTIYNTRHTVSGVPQGKKGPLEPDVATGGMIYGPGTATSDSIPAWLSNGEYVIKAASVASVGRSLLDKINNTGQYAAGGLVGRLGMATGGSVDVGRLFALIREMFNPLASLAKLTAQAAKDAAAAVKPTATYKAAYAAQKAAQADKDADAARVRRLSRAAAATKGVTKADRDLKKARLDLADSNAKLSKSTKVKNDAATEYTKVTDKAKASTDALKQAQQELADQAKGFSDSISDPFRSASHDIDDWLIAMQEGAKNIGALNKQVAQLRKLGLNETLVQQIVSQGATVGGELATQVIKGGAKLVASLNKANTGLQTAADNIGYTQATGIVRKNAAGGLISGPGTGTSDSIPARLSNGEYVVNARATAQNYALLDMINYGRRNDQRSYLSGFAMGGYVQHRPMVNRTVQGGDVNFNGTINVIDPDQLLRKAKDRQRDSLIMTGLTVAV